MNSSNVYDITFIMTCIYWRLRTKRVTLNTLNVRKILTLRKADIALPPPLPKINNSTKLSATIIASKTLMASDKYRSFLKISNHL